jgi:hypothetical protein
MRGAGFDLIAERQHVRNEHWKDCPAKPHDAAAHTDHEDDDAPGKRRPAQKDACKCRY